MVLILKKKPVWWKKSVALQLLHHGGLPRQGDQGLVVDRGLPTRLRSSTSVYQAGCGESRKYRIFFKLAPSYFQWRPNYPYLALLHLNRLEVILNRRRQVWCYLLVNHYLKSLSFVSILFQFYFDSISNSFLFNFYFIWTVSVLFLC